MARKPKKPKYDGELQGAEFWIEVAVIVISVLPCLFEIFTGSDEDREE